MANLLNLKTTTFLPSSNSLRHTQRLPTHLLATRPTTRIRAKIREIFMPALSSTMTEGKIVSWIKSEGDKLSKGDSVVVVESDKADMDVETFYDGFLAKIIVDEGSSAPVGSAIALLAESEAEIADAIAKAMNASPPASNSSESPPSPAVVEIRESLKAPVVKEEKKEGGLSVSTHPASEGGKRVVASPYAKKLGKELGVDLRSVVGSGPQGRIVAKDVDAAAAAAAEKKVVSKDAPVAKAVELGETVPFTTMQNALKSKGVTMTALLAKATALALIKHPVVNSSCRDGKSFTYNSHINIAVAVAMDGGLLTPVLQDADKVDIYTLSRKWKELVDKARAKQLQPHEYSTGTFTLSNLGMFGVDRFDAILPPGTGAIMAVGASQPNVVASKDGRIGMKNQMQVNVTADHRVIYGADLAAFLQTLAQIIEDPKDLTL
uniref:Dihydrolipoamide acetyltransferase component of pyruvate dehydrogenase complex n=1 Tax=Chenopodium quinoa TaxID=63459 RepID=A0A803L048_CHEQI